MPVLTTMLNLLLQTDCFPDSWKQANIHLRPKKPRAEVIINNLCPISNLSLAFKLVEEAVFSQTHDNLTILCLDIETKLMQVMNDILLNMNQQRVTLLVPLDLSTAFITTHLVIPLDHLHTHFGISGHVHSWFKYHLHNRFQPIFINNRTSQSFKAKYSIPKGSYMVLSC